jgi:hypothetical protein
MVDPNPARGMPLQLQRYWLAGKGAVKIRWNTPGDFLRCVRLLAKYFPKDPKGLCNILHTKATGGPPGHGSLEKPLHHSLVAAAELMAKQPKLGKDLWMARIAPIGVPTGEPRRTRVFEPGAFSHRPLPLPFSFREKSGPGHDGSVMVGRVMGITYGPDHTGAEYAWGWGDYFDEEYVPQARTAKYIADQGVLGCSVDPGGKVVVSINPANGWEYTSQYVIGGVTTVSIPAFTEMSVLNFDESTDWWAEDDMDMPAPEEDCGCGDQKPMMAAAEITTDYALTQPDWHSLPLAPRDVVFDNDNAVKNIAAWSGGDASKMRHAFMWQDASQPPEQTTSYRLPLGDVVNGELTMVFHAIYAAAALISGAHGGLPDVPEEDKNHLRNMITDIYKVMAHEYGDSSLRAPWDRPENEGQQFAMANNPQEPYGDVKYADPGYQQDKKKRYPLDSEEHCRAAWDYINMPKNASKYSPEHLKLIKGRIKEALKKYGVTVNDNSNEASMEYSLDTGFPVAPPVSWFQNPDLSARTPLVVTDEGQVYGHLAAWNECHRDVTNRECVLAPHSQMEYAPFHLGSVLTDEGETIKVGKIVQDTRHADVRLGYAAAAIHYDNTGDEVAVVRAGEDEHGIWVAGAIVPEADTKAVAKLRRSPISGDWRAVNGHLELTAALAVNVPAFPVYSLEGEEQLALVAAGVVYPEPDVPEGYQMPYFGVNSTDQPIVDMDVLAAGVLEKIRNREEQEQRAIRLRELEEDDEIYTMRERKARLARLMEDA